MKHSRTLPAATLTLVALLSGCAATSADKAATSSAVTSDAAGSASSTAAATSASSTPGGASSAVAPLVVEQPWAKAAQSGMSAAFGRLRNTTDKPLTVVRASSPASAMTQLHMTVRDSSGQSVMQEAKDGFVVPAHDGRDLAPGGEHLMLMHLRTPLLSGDTVKVVLTTKEAGDITVEFPVRAYSGAKETYGPGSMGTATHDMGAHPSGAASSGVASSGVASTHAGH